MLITLIGIFLGWITYQINWIRQRHEFLSRPNVVVIDDALWEEHPIEAPWQLRPFRETHIAQIEVPKELTDEARHLFPEARYIGSR